MNNNCDPDVEHSNQSFHKTHQLIMIYHQIKFGHKRISISNDILETYFAVPFVVPLSVPASEALLLQCHPSIHTASHIQDSFCILDQRSTGGDARSLVGCHLKEMLHFCQVTSVVFSDACSDSTCADTTYYATYWQQWGTRLSEHSLQRADHHNIWFTGFF